MDRVVLCKYLPLVIILLLKIVKMAFYQKKFRHFFRGKYDTFFYNACSFFYQISNSEFLAIFQRVNVQAVQFQDQLKTQKVENDEVLSIVLKLKESERFIQSVERWLK